MSDLLADARETMAAINGRRERTHHEGCRQDHVECLIAALVDEVERLREAIRSLAAQDATLSVVGGNVTVEMDATLTDAEREAVDRAATWMVQLAKDRGDIHTAWYLCDDAATLRGLLERMK